MWTIDFNREPILNGHISLQRNSLQIAAIVIEADELWYEIFE